MESMSSGLKGSLVALSTIVVCYMLTLNFLSRSEASNFTSDVDVSTLANEIGDWKGTGSFELGVRSARILKLDSYVKRNYANSTLGKVYLYLGYWKKQNGEQQAAKHSPALCFPSNGWGFTALEDKVLNIDVKSKVIPVNVRRSVAKKGRKNQLIYYWFFAGDSNYSEEYEALIRILFQSFFEGRSDGGIIEISSEISSTEDKAEIDKASLKIENFISQMYPELYLNTLKKL